MLTILSDFLQCFVFCVYLTISFVSDCSIMLLIKQFRIGPVTGARSSVLARGRRPKANTADRGPVTRPIRNYLINDNFIN